MKPSYLLHKFTMQILDDRLLSDMQQEDKVIQVFDLFRFAKSYRNGLRVTDCKNGIGVVEENGVYNGIHCCDLLCGAKWYLDGILDMPGELSALRKRFDVKELWLVMIEEGLYSGDLTATEKCIERSIDASFYDRIFYFNSSQPIIKILK